MKLFVKAYVCVRVCMRGNACVHVRVLVRKSIPSLAFANSSTFDSCGSDEVSSCEAKGKLMLTTNMI